MSREKPYLFLDGAGAYNVRVPSAQTDSSGISWAAGITPGRTIPLRDFFVTNPSDSVQTINNQLARGKHLLLTPVFYDVRAPSTSSALTRWSSAWGTQRSPRQRRSTAGGRRCPRRRSPASRSTPALTSPVLLQVGKKNGNNGSKKRDPSNPTTLSDVYFRVGGPHIGRANVALEVNSDNVLIDHTWVWRADPGVEGFCRDTERWNTNTGRNGVIVNGDNVTATGLFVEHFQQYNTIWNGEGGVTILYQNELPYDPPTQADWMHDGVEGWAGYKVADHVRTHALYGGGVYVFNRNNPSIHTENGFEVPETPGVRLRHIMTVNLSAGTIDHVVNGVGGPADVTGIGVPVYIVDYP